ncbi:MAG: hypothetical protein RIR26_2474 [Pseudomonadota bacterium]
MKRDGLNLKYLFATVGLLSFGSQIAFSSSMQKNVRRAIEDDNTIENATGVLDFYAHTNRNKTIRCAAFHIGQNYVATAGHCFLGAMDCNGATVRWSNSSLQAKCVKVVYSNASESFSNGNELSSDLTIFKVDTAPSAKIELAGTSSSATESAVLEAVALPIKIKNGRSGSERTASCRLNVGPTKNIFGQPKAADTATHDCPISENPDGTPLVDARTGHLLAIHQASNQIPVFGEGTTGTESTLKNIQYAKILSHLDMETISRWERTPLTNFRIGGFSTDVFNTGFTEPLALKAVTLPLQDGADTLSFMAHNGLDSTLEVVGADGNRMIFAGPRRAGFEQRFQFKAPVTVIIKSANTGRAPQIWLEDIQAP